MNAWQENFITEAEERFDLKELKKNAADAALTDIAQRYVETFLSSPEVKEKYGDESGLICQAVLHCYHAGVIIRLYQATEEDYAIGEKTYAVLTNMDTVFFSGLMFTRWNVKKRCVNYKTDFMAESLWRLLRFVAPENALACVGEDLISALSLLLIAGASADLEVMDDPPADLNGIPE